jgi:hypothetical protein
LGNSISIYEEEETGKAKKSNLRKSEMTPNKEVKLQHP